MEELIAHSGFEYTKSINDVLSEHNDLFIQNMKFIETTLKEALDKQHFINTKIQEFQDNFLNNKPNPAGILCYPEATPLLQYGFNVIRDFPAFTMISIFEAIEKHEIFFKFWECNEESVFVGIIDDSLFRKKICDLNYCEALIEAVYFVVEGFNYAKLYVHLLEIKNNPNVNIREVITAINKDENETNDFILESIEDYLFEFKDKIQGNGYQVLLSALLEYFKKGTFPKIEQIKVSKINKKSFGWALNQLYRGQRNDALPKEYLLFAKENISLFEDVTFEENDFLKSNLYRYFTTKPL